MPPKTTNYFKVWNRRTRFLALEFFDDTSSLSAAKAFDRIQRIHAQREGDISMFKYAFVSGDWVNLPLVGGL
jgi:hypothetical protein